MGYYEGQRPNPCPRCGGVVATLFISVGSMSFSERCGGCGTTDFTQAEQAQLGVNGPPTVPASRPTGAELAAMSDEEFVAFAGHGRITMDEDDPSTSPVDPVTGMP